MNDIPEDNIVSLQDSLVLINSQIGCTDSLACNYYTNKLFDDGSCEYPNEGYDCDGDFIAQIGDASFGGIVFYVDETGQHGLVVAPEDLHSYNDDVDGFYNWYEATEIVVEIEVNYYDDWRLPSQDEFDIIYNEIGYGSEDFYNLAGFDGHNYWTSTINPNDSSSAWQIAMSQSGLGGYNFLINGGRVRPIRSF